MSETEISLVTMDPDECRALLVSHRPRLGRLAFIDDGWPVVLPMNFAMHGDTIYFRSAGGSKMGVAEHDDRVSFELDHVDEVWEDGWSLLAFGRLHQVTDPEELAVVRQLPLRPWASGDKPYYLRMDVERLSGRRIS